jgi:hypothetical protein
LAVIHSYIKLDDSPRLAAGCLVNEFQRNMSTFLWFALPSIFQVSIDAFYIFLFLKINKGTQWNDSLMLLHNKYIGFKENDQML